MTFQMIHENYNVSDLEKSLAFYGEALGLREVRRNTQPGFTIVYLRDETGHFELELTWLQDHPQKYDLGECEFHLAFAASDFEAAHKKHQEMGCICYKNDAMGIYFIKRMPWAGILYDCTDGAQTDTGWRSCRSAERGKGRGQ